MAKIGSLFADISINTKSLDKSIRVAQRKLRLFGRDATQTGKQLMLGIGAPLSVIGGTAMKTFVEGQDIADLAVFLASSQARYISGQAIAVDGFTESLV